MNNQLGATPAVRTFYPPLPPGQSHVKSNASAITWACPEAATMALRDGSTDRKLHAEPICLGRNERIHEPSLPLRGLNQAPLCYSKPVR